MSLLKAVKYLFTVFRFNFRSKAVLVASMSMQKHSAIFSILYRLNLLFLNIFLAYQGLS